MRQKLVHRFLKKARQQLTQHIALILFANNKTNLIIALKDMKQLISSISIIRAIVLQNNLIDLGY